MNRFFIIVILGFILSGCSANWHIKKAIQKDPDILSKKISIEYIKEKIPIDTVFHIPLYEFLKLDTIPRIIYEKVYINNEINGLI